MPFSDLLFSANNAIGNLRAATEAAIVLTQYGSPPATSAQLTTAWNNLAAASAALNSALAAITASSVGAEAAARSAQSQALASAIQSALTLLTTTTQQVKKLQAAAAGLG